MKRFFFVLFLPIFFSACSSVVHLGDFKLSGMSCEAVEVRTSPLMTLGAMACIKPNGEVTNLVGGAGKPWVEVPLQAAGIATMVGSAIAVGKALKGLDSEVTIVIGP